MKYEIMKLIADPNNAGSGESTAICGFLLAQTMQETAYWLR
jgi:hypothetical protein